MEQKENDKMHELHLGIGDYVYMQRASTGPGRKFQAIFVGPFIDNKSHACT